MECTEIPPRTLGLTLGDRKYKEGYAAGFPSTKSAELFHPSPSSPENEYLEDGPDDSSEDEDGPDESSEDEYRPNKRKRA
jgi:hypothetical protein